MSYVTNVLLSFDVCEESCEQDDGTDIYPLMEAINAWLARAPWVGARPYGAFGPQADSVCGGNKHLETPLYIAAFNYFDLDAFQAFLRTLPWVYPQHVQLLVKDQDEDVFTVYTPCLVPHEVVR